MRKLFIGLIVTFVLSFPMARVGAGQTRYDVKHERKALKVRQKQEWRTLKLQQRNQRRSWKGTRITKAARAQMKHQMDRDKRAMRERQKDDLQNLKDHQRMMKERARRVR